MQASATARETVAQKAESAWQHRLLPFMAGTLCFLALFFCLSIAYETLEVQKHIESSHELDLAPLIRQIDPVDTAQSAAAVLRFRAKVQALLEANVIERRYHQASAAAIGRIYLIFLGFATGMVLAISGATLILGKINEDETSVEGKAASVGAAMKSRSPGLILAFFGTALMICTIFSTVQISVHDEPLYFAPVSEAALSGGGTGIDAATPQSQKSPADILRKQVEPVLKDSGKNGGSK